MEPSLIKNSIRFYKKNRYGAMTLMMTFQSCFGSAAAMLALKQNVTFALIIITVFTMASNAVFIAQAPARWSVGAFLASVTINGILMLSFLFL